jgi:uncharacterized repeat protein (TIGR03803 family)
MPSASVKTASLADSNYGVLFNFGNNPEAADGEGPAAPLIDVNGTLYGTTYLGGTGPPSNPSYGTVFSVTTGGDESVLHSFSGADGATPYSGLAAIGDTLYGTTYAGGGPPPNYGYGVVFAIETSGKKFRVLHHFTNNGPDGLGPAAGLIDVNGTLYGTTTAGGTYDDGTVFSITPKGVERVVYSFKGGSDGAVPFAGLIWYNGEFYGTTSGGGTGHNAGTIFRVSTTGRDERIVFRFDGPNGAVPNASLIAVKGTLYGTTAYGGTDRLGTVFAIDKVGKERVLHSFLNDQSDGLRPAAALVDVNGKLYGTTPYGGYPPSGCQQTGCGTVFSVTPSGKEHIVHDFQKDDRLDGAAPMAALLPVNGRLYGTTENGGFYRVSCGSGRNCAFGTVFSFQPAR